MATSPFPFPYHAAATYHHPSPIGFPTAYTPASTVFPPPPPAPTPIDGHQIGCYTLPFSSYPAPASGAFPTPAYAAPPCSPPSTPCSTPFPFGSSPHHAYGHGFIPTQASQTAYCPNQPPPLPVPATSEFSGDLSSWSPLCSRPMLQQQKDSPTTSWPEPSPALDLEKSKPSAEAQVRAEANISKDMPRAVLDLKRRLDELQARDRTSFDKLRGELAKLTSMATQLAISLSKHSTSPHTSTPAASAAAPASAVSQVFVEMPTPTSWQGTDGTAPNDCSGHHDPIQSTCVSNRSEQNLDYFLEQAAPETIFDVDDDKLDGRSNEFVPMFTATPEQQINGVEQQQDDQPLKCFSKPPETEHNSACLYNLSDVQDFTFEVQPQDDKRACSDPVRKPSDSLAPRCSQLSIDHSMRDLKLQWDPGASAFLVAPLKNDSSKDFSSHNKTDLWSQYEHLLIMFRGVFDEVMLAKPPAKPPDWFGIADSSLQDICFLLEVTPSGKRGAFSLKIFAISALWRNATLTGHKLFGVQILAANSFNMSTCTSVSDTQHICIFVKLWPWSIFSAQHILDSSMKKYIIFSSGRILAENPWSAILPLHYFLWEFSRDKVLSKTTVLNLMDLKHFWAPLLHSWCTIRMSFLQDEYCCLPFVLDCSYSEQVQQLVWYSCMFSTPEAMSTATKLQCRDTYKSTMVQIVVVQFSARMTSIVGPTIMHSYSAGLGWTKVNAAALHVLAVPYSEVTPLAKHYLSLLSQDTQEQDQVLKDNEQTSTYCSRALEHALNCQHSLMSTTLTPQVQSQAIERKPVYDAYNEEDNACLNSVDAVLVHNSEQQKVTNASFVWDPGTMLLWYKCKWCLLYTDEKINWLTEIKCYGVALWLIHFHPP